MILLPGILLGLLMWAILKSFTPTTNRPPPPRSLKQQIEDLQNANSQMKRGLEAFIALRKGVVSGIYEDRCEEITNALTSWDHPSTQEVKNWLVSQGFWCAEIAGIPVYTNGQHTWYATAAPAEPHKHVRTNAVYDLKQTGKRAQLSVWLYTDTTGCIKDMTRTMERASRN